MDNQMRDNLIKIIKTQSVCCNDNDCDKCYYYGDDCVEERLADAIIDSKAIIPENAVVLTDKEYKRYARIEKIIKLAKMEKANGYEVKNGKLYYFSNMLGGCEIEFKDLQEICDALNHYNEEFWGLDQRLTFWKGKAEKVGKETAEKFAERLKHRLDNECDTIYEKVSYSCMYGFERKECFEIIDEICKVITEG